MKLSRLRTLKSMDLSNNALTGKISLTFVDLRNLTLLNLFQIKLYGTISNFIDDILELKVLQLWDINFIDIISWRIGRSGKLQLLNQSSKKLPVYCRMGAAPIQEAPGVQPNPIFFLHFFFFVFFFLIKWITQILWIC